MTSPLFAEYVSLLKPQKLVDESVSLGPDDALLIIDMQADFVPHHPTSNPHGGKFGVAGGDEIVKPVVSLIDAAVAAKATVCATRDYHPHDHCSFLAQGGPFPAHCVQGSPGSKFLAPIGSALAGGVRQLGSEKVFVAFKAMHEHIDSFGALPYKSGGEGRITRGPTLMPDAKDDPGPSPMSCIEAPWTGSLVLKQSALKHANGQDDGNVDMDAPPDVLACEDDGVDRGLQNLQDALKGRKRLFVCGLALDFCVLDTCLNARAAGFEEVYMVYDAARAAHIPGIGAFGSGFLSDPTEVLQKMESANVGFVMARTLSAAEGGMNGGKGSGVRGLLQRMASGKMAPVLSMPAGATPANSGKPRENSSHGDVRKFGGSAGRSGDGSSSSAFDTLACPEECCVYSLFPEHIPPALLQTAEVDVTLTARGRRYSMGFRGGATDFSRHKAVTGAYTPPMKLPAYWPDAPPTATQICYGRPHVVAPGDKHTSPVAKLAFLKISASPELSFAAYGGFLLLDAKGSVVGTQSCDCHAYMSAEQSPHELQFGSQLQWRHEYTKGLEDAERFYPVHQPQLQRKGVTHFCWLSPGETLYAGSTSWVPTERGAFLYLREEAVPLFFEVRPFTSPHVTFLTDVEGNFEYLHHWIERSRAVQLVGVLNDGSLDLELLDGWQLVYGGDSCDMPNVQMARVGGTVRVVKTLVRLKRKYPTRVTLLVGNRDANKMRLTSELAPSQLTDSQLAGLPGPYWLPEEKRVTPLAFLKKLSLPTTPGGRGRCCSEIVEAASSVPESVALALNTPFNRLRWVLTETMTAAGEEERRRKELAHIANLSDVSDEEVFASFVDSVAEDGWMRAYLEHGQLCTIIEGTFYSHGGLVNLPGEWANNTTDCLGYLPGANGQPGTRVDDIHKWAGLLNEWYHTQLNEWAAQPTWKDEAKGPQLLKMCEGYDARGGQALMDYCVGPGGQPSVVLGRHLDAKSMPIAMPTDIVKRLNDAGLRRLIVGHTPHGNCPTVVRHLASGEQASADPSAKVAFELVMCDTSYSDMRSPDHRGTAVSTVDIMSDGTVHVSGVTDSGAPIKYYLPPLLPLGSSSQASSRELTRRGSVQADEFPLIGRFEPVTANGDTTDRRFVKARLAESGDVLMCNVNGFKYAYSRLPLIAALEHFGLSIKGYMSRKTAVYSTEGDSQDERFEENKMMAMIELFVSIDLNGDGALDLTELRDALHQNPTLMDVLGLDSTLGPDELVDQFDTDDADGKVSLQEFMRGFGADVHNQDVLAKLHDREKLAREKLQQKPKPAAAEGAKPPDPHAVAAPTAKPPPTPAAAGGGGTAAAASSAAAADGASLMMPDLTLELELWKQRAVAAEARALEAEAKAVSLERVQVDLQAQVQQQQQQQSAGLRQALGASLGSTKHLGGGSSAKHLGGTRSPFAKSQKGGWERARSHSGSSGFSMLGWFRAKGKGKSSENNTNGSSGDIVSGSI